MNKGGTSDDVIVFYVTTSINGGERPRLDRARSRRNFRENWNKGRAMGHRAFRSIDDKTFFNDIEGINLRNDLVSRSGITGLMERRCRESRIYIEGWIPETEANINVHYNF